MHLVLSRHNPGFVTKFREYPDGTMRWRRHQFERNDVLFDPQSRSGDVENRILIKN